MPATYNADDLIAGIDAYTTRVELAVQAVGDLIAARLEARAKQDAPWQDQTGSAREGLFAFAELSGALVMIYLSHGPDEPLGKALALELGHGGGKFQIIWPTIVSALPELQAKLEEMFR